MARINIEEKWWSDPRKTLLEIKFGFHATSIACQAWLVASWYALHQKTYEIPNIVLTTIDHSDDLIKIGLIRINDNQSFYVRGAKECFGIVGYPWVPVGIDGVMRGGKYSCHV